MTQRLVVEFLADEADELQAGVGGFHHHVEQDDGEIGVVGEDGARFGRRVGMQKFERPAFERHALQCQRRCFVYARLVIDDEDAPDGVPLGFIRRRFFLEGQQIVIRAFGNHRRTQAKTGQSCYPKSVGRGLPGLCCEIYRVRVHIFTPPMVVAKNVRNLRASVEKCAIAIVCVRIVSAAHGDTVLIAWGFYCMRQAVVADITIGLSPVVSG